MHLNVNLSNGCTENTASVNVFISNVKLIVQARSQPIERGLKSGHFCSCLLHFLLNYVVQILHFNNILSTNIAGLACRMVITLFDATKLFPTFFQSAYHTSLPQSVFFTNVH